MSRFMLRLSLFVLLLTCSVWVFSYPCYLQLARYSIRADPRDDHGDPALLDGAGDYDYHAHAVTVIGIAYGRLYWESETSTDAMSEPLNRTVHVWSGVRPEWDVTIASEPDRGDGWLPTASAYHGGSTGGQRRGFTGNRGSVPLWMIAAAPAAICGRLLFGSFTRAHRRRAGRCTACGYSAAKGDDFCPECGTPHVE